MAALVVAGAAVLVSVRRDGSWPSAGPAKSPSFPLPPLSSSPFRNTRPDVRYVGSNACRSCHAAEHASFRHTGMGRSMAPVDLGREPADGSFDHPLSRRRFQVVRKDGQLLHRELLRADGPGGGPERVPSSVVGSGRHSRPTWSRRKDSGGIAGDLVRLKKAWGMSPGYDRKEHSGFGRAVGESCLVCHAGHADPVGGSLHRMDIGRRPSAASVHGPGPCTSSVTQGRSPLTRSPTGSTIPSSTPPICHATWRRPSASSATCAAAPRCSRAGGSSTTSDLACPWKISSTNSASTPRTRR
ncbi:MAG: hypothetical protein WKF75_07520 [Singulisphaera sp.]